MDYPRAVCGLMAAGIVLAGCGHSAGAQRLSLGQVPLAPGTRIVAHARECDRGANAFCALELVIIDRALNSSGALVTLEGQVLRRAGWSTANRGSGTESGADSPDQKLHVVYGTALADLTAWGAGAAKRSRAISLSLSHQVFEHVPAIALTLEAGPA